MAKAKYTRGEDGYFKTNVWTGEYKPDGTKKYKPIRSRKSSADLEKKKKEYEDAVRDRTMIRKSEITFIEYAREWERIYKSTKSYKTREMYDRIVEVHLIALDGVRLQDIGRIHLQMVLNNAAGKSRTCQQISLTFFQILRSALSDNLISQTVYDTIKWSAEKIQYKPDEKRVLTETERKAVFAAQYKYEMDRVFVYLLYGCGVRREECLAFTVFDFDLSDQTASVRRAHEFIHGHPNQKDPKSWNGYRTIPIPDIIFPAVREYIEALRSHGKTYLFTTQSGDPATLSAYRRMWERIISAMQEVAEEPISGLTAHIFRHNFCTMLCYQIPKISIKMIAQLLGDTEKMVLEVYNHIVDQKEDAAGAVNAAII